MDSHINGSKRQTFVPPTTINPPVPVRDNFNPVMVLEHYGYVESDLAPARGFWKNDGSALQRLSKLPELFDLARARNRKIRIVFDYDPDCPRALIQIWGLPTTEFDFSTSASVGEDG